jgi:mRNA-degrading endonuclease HigB of HigAB toxin-antitoxin module
MLTKNIKKQGNNATKKYTAFWNTIILKKFKEPTDIKIDIKISPMDTS